jgi:hypothetical protein
LTAAPASGRTVPMPKRKKPENRDFAVTDRPKPKMPKVTPAQNPYPDLFSDRQLEEIIEDIHDDFHAPTNRPKPKLPPHH